MNTFWRLVKEFWLPFLIAVVWTVFNIPHKPEVWSFKKAVNTFGPSFFLCSWAIAQYFRVRKQAHVENSLHSIESRLKAVVKQVESSTQASTLAHIIDRLQASDVRHARTRILREMVNRTFQEWTDEDREAAALVCATYGPMWALLETGSLEREYFLRTFAPSILDCHSVIQPFVDEMRTPGRASRGYLETYCSVVDAAHTYSNNGAAELRT